MRWPGFLKEAITENQETPSPEPEVESDTEVERQALLSIHSIVRQHCGDAVYAYLVERLGACPEE